MKIDMNQIQGILGQPDVEANLTRHIKGLIADGSTQADIYNAMSYYHQNLNTEDPVFDIIDVMMVNIESGPRAKGREFFPTQLDEALMVSPGRN